MADNLNGKTAIVTGAAHGVGKAIALKLAQAGARVVASDLDGATLDKVVTQIEESGASVTAFTCDMCESLSAPNLMASTLDAYGRVDILVNAARGVTPGGLLDTEDATLMEAIDVNVRSTFAISQAAAKRMIQQSEDDGEERRTSGSIVNVTSIMARRTLPELLHYSVSCAALDQLTRSMAVSLAPHGIRVNAVALGSVMTASLREALRDHADLRSELQKVTPLGRIGEAAEAAEAALFLASDRASFVTGQILAVDGGRTVLDPLGQPAL